MFLLRPQLSPELPTPRARYLHAFAPAGACALEPRIHAPALARSRHCAPARRKQAQSQSRLNARRLPDARHCDCTNTHVKSSISSLNARYLCQLITSWCGAALAGSWRAQTENPQAEGNHGRNVQSRFAEDPLPRRVNCSEAPVLPLSPLKMPIAALPVHIPEKPFVRLEHKGVLNKTYRGNPQKCAAEREIRPAATVKAAGSPTTNISQT